MSGAIVLLLGVVFLVAGAAKLVSPAAFVAVLRRLLPARAVRAAQTFIPIAELALASLLISGAAPRAATGAAIVMLLAFSAILLRMWRRDIAGCGCFGEAANSAPAGLVRNAMLIALASLVLLQTRDGAPVPPAADAEEFIGRLTVALGALCAWPVLVSVAQRHDWILRSGTAAVRGEATHVGHDLIFGTGAAAAVRENTFGRGAMSAVWVVSMVLQWLVIAGLCLLVLSLIRQMGALSLRLNALRDRAGEDGPPLYSKFAAQNVTLVDGAMSRTIGGARERASLLVFLSPHCDACAALPAALTALRGERPAEELDLLVVIAAHRDAARAHASERGLADLPVAASADFPEHALPRHGFPFALALTADGLIAARGAPKTLAHLREMAQAGIRMAELATTHSIREHEWGQSAPYWD